MEKDRRDATGAATARQGRAALGVDRAPAPTGERTPTRGRSRDRPSRGERSDARLVPTAGGGASAAPSAADVPATRGGARRMRISELAARTGTPATTLRYYESAGLLPASRTASGYRLYGEEAVERLAFVDAAKHLGLPLKEIASLLAVWKSGACTQVKAELRPLVAQRLRSAERRRAELDAFAEELTAALDRLDALPDRTGRCDPQCGFLAATPGPNPPPAVRTVADPPPAVRSAPVAAATVNSCTDDDTSVSDSGRWRTAPVACSLTAQETRVRADEWRRAIRGARRSSVTDGLRLTLPVERTSRVAELAVAEQDCCPFLDFRLQLDGPELHLDVRTSESGAPLLDALFGELPQPA